jgi:hypothetical protein
LIWHSHENELYFWSVLASSVVVTSRFSSILSGSPQQVK